MSAARPHPLRSTNLFEQTFKNIDDVLHKDAGCGSELDYVEQSSWMLFLKYLDDVVNPTIGETVYDAAVGSAGFLVEAFDHMKDPKNNGGKKLTVKQMRALQKKTLYGKEKKSMAFIIGTIKRRSICR